MASGRQAVGIEVWLAAQLYDTLRDQVGVSLLFVGVLQKLGRNTLGVDAASHEIVTLVAQHANNLGGQRFVQNLDDGVAVSGVPFGDRALFDMFPGALAQCFDVGKKRFFSHGLCSSLVSHGVYSSI
jgi:hypothetical protein